MPKVLLIDDNLFSLRIYQSMLIELGYHVVTARGGVEGVKAFRENSPTVECVLCDIMMPDMDGFAVFEEIQKISPQIRFYFISSNIQENNKIRARRMGASGFIPKPTTEKELSSILKSGGRYFQISEY